LSAKGKSGDLVSSTTTITVTPRIRPSITIDQATIQRGKSTYLSWNAPGASQVLISGIGTVDISGIAPVSPDETTTYTLTATYIDGTVQSNSVTVNVEQPRYSLWILLFALAVAAIIILFLIFKRPRKIYQTLAATQSGHATSVEETHLTNMLPATEPVLSAVPAKLVIPDGKDIFLASNARSLGRHDFEEFMPAENVSYISRKHINIWFENGHYYIEDPSSTNGTRVNGTDIRGAGRHELTDGDVIELAGKIRITFKENIDKEVQ